MNEIKLNHGFVAVVDDEDYKSVVLRKWRAFRVKNSDLVYAITDEYLGNGKYKSVLMHRFIMQPMDGVTVDHQNSNGLDNRRSNLRFATRTQQQANTRKTKGASRFKGVWLNKANAKWKAHIKIFGKRQYLGQFDTEEEAAKAYNNQAVVFFGEFAKLNIL